MLLMIESPKKYYKFVERCAYALELENYDALIEVTTTKNMGDEYHGYCHGDEEHVIIEVSTFDGAPVPIETQRRTIAHEMIHARQHLSGDLVTEGLQFRYKGRRYDDVDYYNQPWEKEAYKYQDELYDHCMDNDLWCD